MHFTFLVIICASAARGGEEEGFRKGGWSTGPRADRANFYARGTCGETTLGRAQCGNPQLSTSKGGFKTATLQRCLAACDTCSACAFVSFSKRLETCLWFAECDMHQGTPRVQSESLYPHTHPAQTVCMRRGADQHCYGRAPHHLRAGVLMNKSQHAKHALFQTWDARLMPKRRAGIPALLCHAMHSSAAQARACSTIAPSTACQRLAIDLTNYTVITANCKPSLPLCNWTSLREHHQQIGARWIEDCPLAQCYKSHTNSTESQAITSCMKAASCYARRYPDLHAEYGSDSSKSSFLLYLHFLKHGKSEGRRFGCDESEDPKGNLAAESSRNAKAQWAIAETQHNRTVFPWACSLSQVSLTAGLVAPLDNTWSSSVAKRACKMPPPPCLNNNRGRKRPVRPLAFKRVLVSYAYYNPARSLNPHHLQCASNFRFLLDKLLPLDPSAELVVSVIGSSPWPLPDELNATGVRYRHARQLGVDAFTHWEVLAELETKGRLDSYSHFVFLNCGTRGPYLLPHCRKRRFGSSGAIVPVWFQPFLQRLYEANASLVGPTLSCQVAPHVQTHFVAATSHIAFDVLLTQWRPPAEVLSNDRTVTTSQAQTGISEEIVKKVEVGLSEQVMQRGMSIADMHVDQTVCTQLGNNPNPVSQHNPSTRAQHPFKRVFVKHGGSLVANYENFAGGAKGLETPVFDTCKRTFLMVAESYVSSCLVPLPHPQAKYGLASALEQLRDKMAEGRCCSSGPPPF